MHKLTTSNHRVLLMEIIVLVCRLNWRVTLTMVWLFIRKLCIIIGIMLMLCIILGLLMVRCLSLIWYVSQPIFLNLHLHVSCMLLSISIHHSCITKLIALLEKLFILLRLLCSMNLPSTSIRIVRKLVTI